MSEAIARLLTDGGPWLVLVFIVILGAGTVIWLYTTERVIPRGRFEEEKTAKEFWREMALLTSEMGHVLGKLQLSEHYQPPHGKRSNPDED